MITRSDVLGHLERGMRIGFLNGSKEYTPKRSAFVMETGSDGAYESYADMGAVPWPAQMSGQSGSQGTNSRTGAEVVGGVHEGGPITILGGNERTMDVYNRGWDIPIGIYHDAINDGRVGSLENWARRAGSRFEQHKDYICFSALNAGDGDTYGKAYDGQNFFSNSHADKGAQYQTAQDNLYGVALNLDNYETIKVAGANFLDDRGQPGGFSHDLILHGPDLSRTAAQITSNPDDYATGNRARNPYTQSRSIEVPGGWFDTGAWVALDVSVPSNMPINLQIRQMPILVFWDDHTQGGGVRYYKWYARYEVFYGDWRLAIMGNS